jgi:hypothetical protein
MGYDPCGLNSRSFGSAIMAVSSEKLELHVRRLAT